MRFIEDGMDEVERNVKRSTDFIIAAISIVVF